MPEEKSGGFGLVREWQQPPGWNPSRGEEAVQARQFEEARQHLTRLSQLETDKYRLRRLPPPPLPYEPKSANVEPPNPGKLSELAGEIAARGCLSVDVPALVLRGRELFRELIELNRGARGSGIGPGLDLTAWSQVQKRLADLGALFSPVPPLTADEQLRGLKIPPEAKIDSFSALWKSDDPLARKVRLFYEAFARAVFGQSLLQACDEHGRLKSPFLVSGLEREFSLFDSRLESWTFWKPFIRPPTGEHLIVINFGAPLLWSVVAWLGDDSELAKSISATDCVDTLARELSGKRVPDAALRRKTVGLLPSYCLGYDLIGAPDKSALETWDLLGGSFGTQMNYTWVRREVESLARRFTITRKFHQAFLDECSVGERTYSDGITTRLDPQAFRSRLDQVILGNVATARQLIALSIAEALGTGECIAAAIADQIVVTTSAKGVVENQLLEKLQTLVSETLLGAFPGLAFRANIDVKESL
jgi:hypothetical protein